MFQGWPLSWRYTVTGGASHPSRSLNTLEVGRTSINGLELSDVHLYDQDPRGTPIASTDCAGCQYYQ